MPENTVARKHPTETTMPLPSHPTQRPNTAATRKADNKADKDLLAKGALCALIGAAVLASPYFIHSPGVRDMVAKAALTGWFGLVLGLAFIGMYLRRRVAAAKRS